MIDWLKNFLTKPTAKPTGWINQTNLEHAVAAIAIQLVIGFATGNWFAGACFSIAFFLGREHAQEQDKIGYSIKLSLQAFDFRRWSWDSKMDLLFPVIACLIILVIATLLT